VNQIQEKDQRGTLDGLKEPLFLGGNRPTWTCSWTSPKDTKLGVLSTGEAMPVFLREHGTPRDRVGPDGDLSAHAYDEHVNVGQPV